MENAASLEATDDGVMVAALFEEPVRLRDAVIQRIDFLENKLTLVKRKETA